MASPAYEGGTGGKFRKRPLRRAPSTPYDRPPSAARVLRVFPPAAGSDGWLSKLVDPASRFIAGSASRIFSSVFRKRLAAPPAVSEENHQSRPEVPEVACIMQNLSSKLEDQGDKSGANPTNSSSTDGISDLELLLKQKTFTRVEFDHLMELLRSRTIEPINEKKEKENCSSQENNVGKSGLYESFSTHAGNLTIPNDATALPTELAKAYMGSRPSKISSSPLSLRTQVFQEDAALPTIAPFAPKPFNQSVAPRSVVSFSGISELPENCHQTPKPRGRSAICRMSCSPYFRGGLPTGYGYTGPSSSSSSSYQLTPRNVMHSGGKQVLQRGSSVLDADFGSFGPIRRVRQKSYFMSPSKDSHSSPLNKDVFRGSTSVRKPSRLDEENGENKMSYSSVAPSPPKSSETGMKILQHLDRLVPSPKEEWSEPKALARDESSSKLMQNILDGWPPKSIGVDSSKIFNVQGSGNMGGINCDSELLSLRSSPSGKQKVQENVPSKPAVSENPVFEMSAPEVSLLSDDDKYNTPGASGSLSTETYKLESKLSKQKTAIYETAFLEKSLVSSSKNIPGSSSISFSEADRRASGISSVAEKYGFTFSDAQASSSHSRSPPTPTMSTASLDRSALRKEQLAAPVYSFGPRASLPLTYSSTMARVNDIAFQNVGASNAITATTIEGSTLDKGGEMQEAGELSKASDNVVTSGTATSTTSVFGFAASAAPSQSNGSLPSSPFTFPVSAVPAVTLTDSLASSTFSTSTSSPSVSHPVNSSDSTNMEAMPFKASTFGIDSSSLRTSSSFSSSGNGSSLRTSSFSSSGNGSSSPATDIFSTKKGILGFNGSVPPSTSSISFSNSTSQNYTTNFGATAGSFFGAQSTHSGSGSSHFSQSSTSQFGPLFSSPTLGLSNPFSPFGSTTSDTKSFTRSEFTFSVGSGSSSPGISSSLVPAEATSLFGHRSQPSSSSVFGFTSDSTTSTSTGFSFGPTSTASCSSSSSFGLSTGSTSASSPAWPVFGMPTLAVGFSSGSPENDQMNVEDSMADDMNQAAAVPMVSPAPPNLGLGSVVPSGGTPVFQFSSHQNSSFPQSSSPFQAGNQEFLPGGGFSQGSGGGDKSGRRIIRVKRDKLRKK